jgi:hypothetical protein
MSIGKWVGLAVSVIASAVLSIATAGAYAAIAAATIGAAVKGYAASFAVGAAAGAISAFASSTVEQAIDTGDIDWQRVGASVLIGGAIGGVAGAAQHGAIYAKQVAGKAQVRASQQLATLKGDLAGAKQRIANNAPMDFNRPGMDAAMRMQAEINSIPKLELNIKLETAIVWKKLDQFALGNKLITAGASSFGSAAAWGTDLLVPTPTAGGVPTPLPPAIAPEDGTVDVGSEGGALLEAAFG